MLMKRFYIIMLYVLCVSQASMKVRYLAFSSDVGEAVRPVVPVWMVSVYVQHAATRCNMLQHAAICCNTLDVGETVRTVVSVWMVSVCVCQAPQLAAARCNALQHTATHWMLARYR